MSLRPVILSEQGKVGLAFSVDVINDHSHQQLPLRADHPETGLTFTTKSGARLVGMYFMNAATSCKSEWLLLPFGRGSALFFMFLGMFER